ncbi:PqqD family protein [candidate division CSSED10-310 bacterium]|uniref:PqqD family protein n=1 Tax=candidate division CSSED10-310 bacterium TaxID=2855610 RepID=A0ABV6YSG2_UNCC1
MVAPKPKFHPQVKFTIIADEGLIITQDSGEVHIVNQVASFLLPLLTGHFTLEELTDRVMTEFDVGREEALQDIETFLQDLEARGIIIYES